MTKEKPILYHNNIVKWLRERVEKEFPKDKMYTTFEDIPELRKGLSEGKLAIDLRYSVDLIQVEISEEKRDEKAEGEGVKVVFYYTLFLVSTGSISDEEPSKISGISDSLRERLIFYQYYFSSIAEPKYVRIVLVVPSDTDISPEAKCEVFKAYKIGLWRIDVEGDKKKEEVPAMYFRKRMAEEFNVSIKDPKDVGEAIKSIAKEIAVPETILKQAIEEKAEDFATFFEQYVLEAVEAIAEIRPEHIGKRYIDRTLIDSVFDLRNISYIAELRNLVNEHLNHKSNDHLFTGKCFSSLWESNFSMSFPTTLGDYEQFLQQFFPQYREHFVHQFQVFLLGTIIVDHLLQDPERLFENGSIEEKKGNLAKGWLLASSIHDFTYPLQKYDEWSVGFFRQQLGIDEPPSFLDLKSIYVEEAFLTRVEQLLSNLEKDFIATDNWEKAKFYNGIRCFFYYQIAEKKNHGLMGSCYLLKRFEGKQREEFLNIVLPAAVASAIHDDEIWQTLSGNINGGMKKKWGCIADLLGIGEDIARDILRESDINDEQKENRIAEKLRDEKEEWVGNIYTDICNIITKKPLSEVYLKRQPLAFLIILCDNLQDCGRPCRGEELKEEIEEADIRLKEISFDSDSHTLTIQLFFNTTEKTLDFMSKKIKLLRKMEKFLRSPDFKFEIEYWDREKGGPEHFFKIN